MRSTIGVLAIAIGSFAWFGGPAMAQSSRTPLHFALAPGTYALRSLCATHGENDIKVFTPDGNTVIAETSEFCVNGRTGVTFTVPPGTTRPIGVAAAFDPVVADLKLRINRDCPEDTTTTCTFEITNPTGIPRQDVGTAAGVITYPGDIDWYILPDNLTNISFTVPAGCFAAGKAVVVPIDPDDGGGNQIFLAVLGGPSSCTYQITARHRRFVGN